MTGPQSTSRGQGRDLPPVSRGTPMPPNDELYLIADELRAIGNMGMRFAENSYDTERYERVRAASARIVAALERRSPDEVLERYDDNLGPTS